jgi:hypothetical protein
LQYHVDKFVCRPLERPDDPMKMGHRPSQPQTDEKRIANIAGSKKKRSDEDDDSISDSSCYPIMEDDDEVGTYIGSLFNYGDKAKQPKSHDCPFCGKRYSSARFLQYHVDKLVCQYPEPSPPHYGDNDGQSLDGNPPHYGDNDGPSSEGNENYEINLTV